MSRIVTGPASYTFARGGSSYLPFHGNGFSNAYYVTEPYDYDTLTYQGGTSGPDGVAVWDTMALFLTDQGGSIASDGETVTVTIPVGQKLLVMDDTRSDTEKWKEYARLVEIPYVEKVARQDFWFLPEYVTWVEQGMVSKQTGQSQREVLDEKFVLDYMDRIEALGLPKGKLTLDDGWQEILSPDDWTDGYWRPDAKKFPDFEGLMAQIAQRGFVPSLWVGIPSVPTSAPIVQQQPELFAPMPKAMRMNRYYYKPSDALTEHYKKVLTPLAQMGVRKFKFDFFYGERQVMRASMKCLHDAVRAIDPTIEIESHHPDPFFSCYLDAFRLNDVHVVPGFDWKGLTLEHINLGNNLATDCILNLDHLGGNTGSVAEDGFLRHCKLFDFVDPEKAQYPVISILPDKYSDKAVQTVFDYIQTHTVIK